MLRRRDLLLGGMAALGLSSMGLGRRASAIGDSSRFTIGQLALAGAGGDGRPNSLRYLLLEIDKRTSIECATQPQPVKLSDTRLHATPFLWLTGETGFTLPPDRELGALRRFLGAGGFLVIDSAAGRVGSDFDVQARRLCSALYPESASKLAPLPDEHVIYKSFYLLGGAPGRLALAPRLEAVTHDNRAVVVYTQNDLAGAFSKDEYGRPIHECYPGGERQRELAFRFGVNLAMYALCLDYKTDQVHVPFILKRRRWKADPGP